MAALVALLVIPDGALAVGSSGNDRDDGRLAQALSQCVRIVSLVGKKVSRAFQASQQMGRDRAVCRVAAGQHEGERAADHVGEGMDFGGLSAPRRPDGLIFRPPLPPWAERCALM